MNTLLETCRRGHPRTEANVYVSPDGRRICRPCRSAYVGPYQRARAGSRPATDKACSTCGEVKPPEAFYKCRSTVDGRDHYCIPCKRKQSTAWRAKQRGIDFDEEYERQGGVCAICNEPDPSRRLAIDHDHESGAFRGLLCGPCNRAIGLLREDSALLANAIAYLETSRG